MKESWVVLLRKLMVLILAVPLKVPHAIGCGKKQQNNNNLTGNFVINIRKCVIKPL